MNDENFEKLGELILAFTKKCNDIVFEVMGVNIENTIELEIRSKRERHLETE